MNAIAAYMASRTPSREEGEHRNNYPESRNKPGRREYENRSEYGGAENRVYGAEHQPNRYPRNEMGGRDGREMNDYGGNESRYRGRDGRWRAGTRRGEYEGGTYGNDPMDRRMGDDEDEEEEYNVTVQPRNVIQWPYMPHEPPDSRMIGFGTRDREYQTRSHYGEGTGHSMQKGGDDWMAHGQQKYDDGGMEMLDRETAERWVRSMRNEDSARPTGPRWSMDELKPMAQKFGIKPDPENEAFIEFWAMTNAMYSDYCGVAKKFNITSPEYYGMMALAWKKDKDAVPNKTAMYYEHCVKK